MSASTRRLTHPILGLALLLAPGMLAAQSILGTKGLGFSLEAMDARARALGSVGTGLFGGSLTPLDPASATGLLIPTANLTFQPYWEKGTLDGKSVDGQGMRFPLVGVAYPVPALNASCPTLSRSTITTPSSSRNCATVLLPLPIPPVSPMTFILFYTR